MGLQVEEEPLEGLTGVEVCGGEGGRGSSGEEVSGGIGRRQLVGGRRWARQEMAPYGPGLCPDEYHMPDKRWDLACRLARAGGTFHRRRPPPCHHRSRRRRRCNSPYHSRAVPTPATSTTRVHSAAVSLMPMLISDGLHTGQPQGAVSSWRRRGEAAARHPRWGLDWRAAQPAVWRRCRRQMRGLRAGLRVRILSFIPPRPTSSAGPSAGLT